ncbi:hypothetical protein PULV_a2563 [Pseudoalteromonas ulvae UL12]|uniref:Secreted protein n=1 Tax=Pseudoalteromonas ulvae TaxID=107327 RepID=A0A244CP65_PSEDV|nr:hypothetical protein [Pseudoalteromonas ulvae]MBE0364270.1 hypothetical protein [Pseudoalteromonas ulvae UL12]OUL57411.1 hypothetical protein B1199_14705 [Pseudoalteromonas ulvae]
MKISTIATASCLLWGHSAFAQAPLVSIPTQDQFFDKLSVLCGKAFSGKVTEGNSADSAFSEKKLVMHVRRCTDSELQIPFHVGDNASRTWIITKTGSGLSLKHDHRMKNGEDDKSTMYGGHTVDAGWPQAQSFPADHYSKELFVASGIPQSTGNTWHMYIYPEKFTYRLTREGREFRVDFDLTQPVQAPPAPWGYKD